MTVAELKTLLHEKKFDAVERAFLEALEDPVPNADLLLAVAAGLSRASQKSLLQKLASTADGLLKGGGSTELARFRWDLLKETVKGGGTPSTPDGFHRLFEEAIAAAYPSSAALGTLLGRFKFREAKTPLDGLTRLEKVEKWIPFDVGKVFSLPGRGAGVVVEMNFGLDCIRVDFEKAKGIAIPIGVAAKGMTQLPEGHFLREKLTNQKALSASVQADPPGALHRVITSFGRNVTFGELKEAITGLVPEDRWNGWWTAARKHPQVIVHGTGKSSTVEWSASADEAEDLLMARFEKSPPEEQLDFFRKYGKRSPELAAKLATVLGAEAERLRSSDPAAAFEIAVAVEKSPGVSLTFAPEALIPDDPLPFVARLADRLARERALEATARRDAAGAVKLFSDWFMKEEDLRTLDLLDRRLEEADPALRGQLFDRLLKNPRQGARAFYWYMAKAGDDEALRTRLSPAVLSRLLDGLSWSELSAVRVKIREMFDRTGLVASWLLKQATMDDARAFLESLSRHHELEPHRRHGLEKAAEMRFPELKKAGAHDDEPFFVTHEAIEEKRHELEHLLKVDIPENTKGIALAAAEGDLSENFEYKARRDKQQLLSARAGRLQAQLALAKALDPATVDASEVRPGTRVLLEATAGRKAVTLLGPWDSKPEEGTYSYLSDLGKALLGKKPGEAVQVLGEPAVIAAIEPWR